MQELLDEEFVQRFGMGPKDPSQDLQEDLEQLLQDDSLPDELRPQEVITKPHPFLQSFAKQAAKDAKRSYDEHCLSFMDAAANHMDHSFGVVEPLLKQAIADHDLSSFWTVFWNTVESSTLQFTGHNSDDGSHGYRGRGKYPVSLREVKTPTVSADGTDYSFHTPAWLSTLQNHHNRCIHAASNLAMIAKGKLPQRKLDEILMHNGNCSARIISFLEWQRSHTDLFTLPVNGENAEEAMASPFDPATLIDKLKQDSTLAQSLALKKECRKYAAYIQRWQTHFSRETEQQAKAQFLKLQTNVGAMCGVVKGAKSAPISRLRLESSAKQGQDEITTNPGKIDDALKAIWGTIHQGNVGRATQQNLSSIFLREFAQHFTFAEEFKVPILDAKSLRDGIQACIENASGLDGVQASDLQLLSNVALEWLACMLNAIEGGDAWPQQTLVGRTSWLDKTDGPEPSLDPLEYRGLAILSKVYRLYAAIRLRHLQPWVKNWEHEELFAGTSAATGAEDAWFLLGLECEEARLLGHTVTGGSADIWKCFDQHQRALLYDLLAHAGFPGPILKAYNAFHENLPYHNTIGQGLGAPHFKPCSIPQGCPFSMMFTGFTFHPWVSLMKSLGVKPRGLADDLTITATGEGHEKRFRQGYEVTMQYLKALGAKPAPKKCFTFSTSPDTRFRLSNHYWQELGAKVEVVLEARDLGGHLSTKAVLGGSTLAKRMRKATAYCYRLAAMPWSKQAKQRVVETLIYPLALYGCEAAPIYDSDMAKLTAAVAKAVGFYTHSSSNLMTAMLSAKGRNFCGQFTVLNRSLALLRRIIYKHPLIKMKIQSI